MDPEKREFFAKWLEKQGFNDIKLTSEKCRYDVIAKKDDKNYIFELKNRPINSDKYGDSIIQNDKYNFLLKLSQENNEIFIVNFFTDCFYIVPLNYEHEEQHWNCQKTNNWDRTRVPKILISYKHNKKYKRYYD